MKTKDIVNIALFVTLLAVCAWICIPAAVPFTMQTFTVFLAMLVLGGRKGTIVIMIYLLLGIIGVPVFSRGTAGIGIVFGSTGGYMFGWILLGMIMWSIDTLTKNRSKNKKKFQVVGMVLGMIICYLFGTIWFVSVYARNAQMVGFTTALGMCVVPFIIPDLIKMVLAFAMSKRIRKVIGNV